MKIIKGLSSSLILFLIIISALFINVIPSFATDPCTGGTATIDGNYTVRTFPSNGALVCTAEIVADIIFVAGGGGGGSNRGSGGGAGGIVVTSGSLPAYTYNIVIGAGGSGGTDQNDNATAGGDTSLGIAGSSIFVVNGGGRGRGGTVGGAYSALTGGDGVSAGGGCYGGPSGSFTGGQQGPTGSQGHAGGGSSNSSPSYGAGGGGGAGAVASDGTSTGGGKGGDGLSNSITGTAKYYGGGGGGGQLSISQSNSGGQGGGGNGAGYNTAVPATAGLNGYGGGGGGGGDGGTAAYNAGAAGGSGVVIFRYLTSGSSTYTITASAGSNGSISPSGDITVNSGATQTFTLTPNANYHISSVTGCGGTLNGNTYTTAPITAACNVTATFAINTYTVTPSAGANGSISPSEVQTVNYGGTAPFTVSPNTGYSIASVTGCGGIINGNTYTTGPITADCSVSASFVLTGGGYNPVSGNLKYYYDDLNRLIFIEDTVAVKLVEYQYDEVGNRLHKIAHNSSYLILAKAGNNGSITNTGATIVQQGSAQSYTYNITPATGYVVSNVIVDGSSVGAVTSYTFDSVNASHTISATFTSIDISIGNNYYPTLQSAYNAANNGDTIKVTAKNLTENLNVNRNISVNLEGGYDQAHTSITGTTNMKGMIQTFAGGGTLTIKNFILQN